MRLLFLEATVSVVYVFDVGAYPFVHIPIEYLTLLYFASMIELFGLFHFVRFVRRRLAAFKDQSRTLFAKTANDFFVL